VSEDRAKLLPFRLDQIPDEIRGYTADDDDFI
jgi:hypothetical protein